MDDPYKVFLNEKVSAKFSAMHKSEKQRFAEKMRFLAAGIWEGGILVKKLSGVKPKVLFEARISKGDRVLFTLGKYGDRSAAYIWAYLKHDDVDRKARLGMPDNAPFLDFPSSVEEQIDTLYLDAVQESWHSQESLEDKVESDYGPQKWNVLDDADWERAISAGADKEIEYQLFLSREQYSILDSEPPILLSGTAGSGKTTIALYYLSRKEFLGRKRLFATYSPYLRDFAARLYQGLMRGNDLEDKPPFPEFLTIDEAQRRYIPGSSPLADPTKLVGLEAFKTLISANPLSRKFDPELLWEEIRSIIKGAMPPFSLKRLETVAQKLCSGTASSRERQELAAELADFSRFSFGGKLDAIVASATSFEGLEAFANAVGSSPQEGENQAIIRALDFLKKKKELFSRPLLSLEEYLYIGEKRAPIFLHDRTELYSLALYYQKKLEERGLYDEIDLAKRALAERKRSPSPDLWDLVVCDEIQDMTDTHVELLFDLAADRNKVFFAGDERQTVNPSGFRWEGVRARFYESGSKVPDLSRLSMNFRSCGAIVELGNALLDLKRTFIGAGKFESPETWKFSGKAPVVIEGIQENAILDIVRQSGADRIILTRSTEEKLRLKTLLGTELVFTIFEAKGLEFDTVLLWKFIEDRETERLWEAMGEGSGGASEDMIPHLRHELNLLYVAVARARSILAVYDGERPSSVWKAGRLPSIVVMAKEASFLMESWSKASTPEAWARQGDGLYKRGYYKSAAECYRHGGLPAKEDLSLAHAAMEEGDFGEAAPRFERRGETARAALCYEKIGNLEKAHILYAKLGDKTAAKRLKVLALEKAGDWLKAGKLRFKMGEQAKAIEDWEKGNAQGILASHYIKIKDYPRAAHSYEKAGDVAKAITCYKKYRNYEKAAELLLSSGQEEKALRMFRRAGGASGYLEFCRRSGKPELIAGAYLELGKYEDAMRLYKEYVSSAHDAAEILRNQALAFAAKRKHERAAILFTVLESHEEAGEAFRKAGDYKRAATAFSLANRHYDAAILFQGTKQADKALAAWKAYHPDSHEKRVEKIEAIRSLHWQLLGKNPTASKNYNQSIANALFAEATDRFDSGDYLNSLAITLQFKEKDYVIESLLHLADDMLAVYAIAMDGDYALWTVYRARKKTIRLDPIVAVNYLSSSYSGLGNIEKRTESAIDGLLLLLNDISSFVGKVFLEPLYIKLEYFISSIEYYLQKDRNRILRWGDSYLTMLASLKQYTRIISVGRTWSGLKISDVDIEKIIAGIDDLAAARNDDTLLLCMASIKERRPDQAILDRIIVDESNWKVMRFYFDMKEKLLDFLLGKFMFFEAAEILARFDGAAKAAELLEAHNLFKEAASYYESALEWQKAEALYLRSGDEKSIARLYEHKGDFTEAIERWKKLGYPKQAARLEKKAQKFTDRGQTPLFNF